MRNKLLFAFATILMVFAIACRQDSFISETSIDFPEPEIIVSAQIDGLVTDSDGIALEGATVAMNNEITTTDQNGYFKLAGLADSKHQMIKVHKEGYFDNYEVFRPTTAATDYTRIRLTQKDSPISLDASAGGTVSTTSQAKIEFAPNGFVDQNGNPYSGSVNVYSFYINPTDENLDEIMPGALIGENEEGEETGMESFGMIKVELEGENGEDLQINKNATIQLPIPNELLDRAPSTIPLWHFDEAKGIWVEEGQATLENGVYVGEVSHFTYWNCDVPVDVIWLKGNVEFRDDLNPATMMLSITVVNTGETRSGYLNTLGGYGGWVPKNQELKLQLIQPECSQVLLDEQTVGPFSDDANVPAMHVDLTNLTDLVTLSGKVVDCSQNVVDNGYVLVTALDPVTNYLFPLKADGSFHRSFFKCGSKDFLIYPMDLNKLTQGVPQVYNFDEPNQNLGILNACDQQIEHGVTLRFDGNEYTIPECQAQIVLTQPSSGLVKTYLFDFEDKSHPGGSVRYTMGFANVPGTLYWQIVDSEWTYEVIGSPAIQYQIMRPASSSVVSIQTLLEDENPGGLLLIKIPVQQGTGLGLSEIHSNGTVNEYDEVEIQISAIVQ